MPELSIRSLSSKILMVLLAFTASLTAVYIVLSSRVEVIDNTLINTLNVSKSSVSVLKINKEIVELQRDISVFSSSGSPAIYEKVQANQKLINTRLLEIKSKAQSEVEKQLIDSLLEIVSRYGSNLSVLMQRYQERKYLLQIQLPEVFKEAEVYLRLFLNNSDSSQDKITIYQLLDLWLTLYRDANLYLTQKDYKKKKAVLDGLEKIENKLLFSNKVSGDITSNLQAQVHKFRDAFNKSIQANRNYLTLVNVVMAGDAVEFSNLVDKLRTDSLSRLDYIRNTAEEKVLDFERIIKISMAVGLLFLVFFVLFFHFHIIRSIKRLTENFQHCIEGNLSDEIKGLERKDEIGTLANAANQFKLLSEALIEAKQVAEHTSKIKSDFLANMSHEIRTPMNGILGMVRQLRQTDLNKEQINMLELVDSSGKSLLVILNDILDLSKIEAGKIELESQPFALNKLLYELEHTGKTLNKSSSAKLIIENNIPIKLNVLAGDVVRLKQVLLNLLSNAIKFTEQGTVKLLVEVQEENVDKAQLKFSVIDTGIGIPQDRIEMLFEAFSQADTSITRRFGGTGLGLTISNKLLDLMNSRLEVESRLGEGSTFSFTVTFPISELVNEDIDSQFQEIKLTINRDIEILLVEDNKINQIVTKSMLKDMGLENIIIAENGLEAVEFCKAEKFGLILMDMQMPEMDGPTAAQHIRKYRDYRDIPIIALTANVLEQDKKRCLEVGMSAFISKPIDHHEFVQVVYKALKQPDSKASSSQINLA
ncbi:hybrid sensor histidine kinase/response regulator [Pseudoalteromonas maricaloris]|uniref:Sensory/regulatory protein RpfC n=1 Tax=Pseudoalteromonas maricaloris TaxID=184924 RepID=A0A8I2H1N7_9GAMM|nr:ATP-binding protein [Pseudoalteromonas maricaloris]NLR21718.1 response regulator [Pseudoalteromonas maricaloris]WOX28259.1 ATP-binding protein [Pseudoalteromonas maricaloris]